MRHQLNLEPVPALKKSDRTRTAILDEALEFLWNSPYRDMSVAKLTGRLGISRGAFYQYFPNVYALMETLLLELESEVLARAKPWFVEAGDVRQLLHESLSELVEVNYEYGPVLRAVADAAPNDQRLEALWLAFLGRFDDAITARIESDQAQGLIPAFDARTVAMSLNRMDVYALIQAFGTHPRSEPGQFLAAVSRIWSSTLYSHSEAKRNKKLVRQATGDSNF